MFAPLARAVTIRRTTPTQTPMPAARRMGDFRLGFHRIARSVATLSPASSPASPRRVE